MERGDILLQGEELGRRDGPVARLRGLDLELRAGEVTALLGVNGAGKSTALALLSGALRPTRGRVRVLGLDLHRQPRQARRHLGLLPERPPLYPELTVDENLDFAARLRGLDRRQARQARRRVKRQLDLTTFGRRLAGRLSRGMAQRVGIAQALVHEPEVVILDEPTAGLDPAQARELRQLIAGLGDGRAVLMATHLLQDVEQLCQQVIILREGRPVTRERLGEGKGARIHLQRPPAPGELQKLPGITRVTEQHDGWFELALEAPPETVARELALRDWGLTDFIQHRHDTERLVNLMVEA